MYRHAQIGRRLAWLDLKAFAQALQQRFAAQHAIGDAVAEVNGVLPSVFKLRKR